MVPVVYQAYPGGPQQVYYMPASQVHPHTHQGMMESMRSRIRKLASTDQLEGFSLRDMFSEVFKRHGAEAVEEYVMVGSARTTPPLDYVETGWPKAWMFFRLLATFVAAYIVLALAFGYTSNEKLVPGIMLLGAFAVPLATLVLFFELNTPRNVSVLAVGRLFLLGAVVSLCFALLGYAIPIFDVSTMEAGIVEEAAKLFTVVVVMRSVRYKYELNGILFGATVGAGFACFETMGYAFDALLQGMQNGANGGNAGQVIGGGVSSMLGLLVLRGIEAPLGHVAWTAITAGAFWRVKQDRPTSPAMFLDKHFLMAFAIPVVMHALWDAPLQLPFSGNQIITGLVTWYVVFGLVQQGLRQVKQEQMAHLQSTLSRVEATLLPGTMAMQPAAAQAPLA
jgi:RsiW-degrading membrane proteinase PrsW (M82 family)